ncbi:MAG: Na(+)-translocating NADH-quinone reductase subunit A [Saprospiraceae bacterium]|nr:Na(+)-translocating NADH-quinone reductase subunit A [Saprospiraceae bacterium]
MKFRLVLLLCLLAVKEVAAQDGLSPSSWGWFLGLVAVLLFLAVMSNLASNLITVEATKQGVSSSGFGIWNWRLGNKLDLPKEADEVFVLKKGHDILLEGKAEKKWLQREVKTFAVQPPDFEGISPIPKMMVEEGQEVKAGTPLFYDKKRPEILYVSPVSGEFIELNRGEKRSIAEVVILADSDQKFVQHTVPSLENRKEVIEFMKKSGAWTLLRQRPFDVVPEPDVTPKNIFVSTFDTGPLAPDNNFIVDGRGEDFQKGLDVLNQLTDGKVYLGLDAKEMAAEEFVNARDVEKKWFYGKHPAGNVGVQIHHIAPIKVGDVVWCLGVQDILVLGHLFNTGRFNNERTIALTGAPLAETGYVKTRAGARISDLVGDIEKDDYRFVSGDVLSGKKMGKEGFMRSFDDQLTVLEEGDYYEMFGWLIPHSLRPSVSGTYPNRLFSDLRYEADTNTHGEKRAFVVTGQYEKLLPMDIYLQALMKAIITNDFERMEGLGIHELSEEDVALCEFACTSKQPLQKILRDGLDMVREQS